MGNTRVFLGVEVVLTDEQKKFNFDRLFHQIEIDTLPNWISLVMGTEESYFLAIRSTVLDLSVYEPYVKDIPTNMHDELKGFDLMEFCIDNNITMKEDSKVGWKFLRVY